MLFAKLEENLLHQSPQYCGNDLLVKHAHVLHWRTNRMNITFSYTMFHDIFLEVENVADNLLVEQSEYPQSNILLLWLCETANWMNRLHKLHVNVGFGG